MDKSRGKEGLSRDSRSRELVLGCAEKSLRLEGLSKNSRSLTKDSVSFNHEEPIDFASESANEENPTDPIESFESLSRTKSFLEVPNSFQ